MHIGWVSKQRCLDTFDMTSALFRTENAVPVRLVLASGSPRRRELLAELGLPFAVIVSDAPETNDPSLTPEEQAIALAARKARAVARTLPGGLVLGADTIVVLDDQLFGKPIDDEDASRMLFLLSGRAHRVITGLALLDAATGAIHAAAVETIVHMRPLTDDEIAAYVATGESADKAGAYAIQGLGAGLIDGLHGCWANVVGLPLCAVAELLARADVSPVATWRGCRLPNGERCSRAMPGV